MRIDATALSVVAICDTCSWREMRPTPAAAWTALAQHAKSVHGDYRAVARARDAAWQHKARAAARAKR